MLTLLFDGVAYGMLLFILAVGLAVTMGLMNFINLAHGAFAMLGGYITVLLMQRQGVPFLACLPLAFLGAALLGGLLERTLYRPLYKRPHLDQVLFSIGLTFMAVASANYLGYLVGALLCMLQPWFWTRFPSLPSLAFSQLVRGGLLMTGVLIGKITSKSELSKF
jgi:branched-chain amino acid transport system permease protein